MINLFVCDLSQHQQLVNLLLVTYFIWNLQIQFSATKYYSQKKGRKKKEMVGSLQEIFYLYYKGTVHYVKRKIMFLVYIGK